MIGPYKSTPTGVCNVGRLGDGVSAFFIAAFGSRAQRRMLERHLKNEVRKRKLAEAPKKRSG